MTVDSRKTLSNSVRIEGATAKTGRNAYGKRVLRYYVEEAAEKES